jgi:hypothetical protein
VLKIITMAEVLVGQGFLTFSGENPKIFFEKFLEN